jgi:Uncharacterised protein family (UPF0236).
METSVNELADILKSESNIIAKERAVVVFLMQVICWIFVQALHQVDNSLIDEQKSKGYRIEKMSVRTIVTSFGEIQYTRRRYVDTNGNAIYPLDTLMGWDKYSRYSTLVVRNLSELATKLTYRSAAKAIELFAPFSISHQKINALVKEAGQNLKKQQTSDQRYDALENTKRTPKVLYLEGDGFQIKTQGKQYLEVHRFQICEGVQLVGKNRKKRIHSRDFVSIDRQTAMKELMEYWDNAYNLKQTVIISNGDGGSGYTKDVFDELSYTAARHEYFLDAFHVNKKIKDRLYFAKELQGPLIQAIWRDYNEKRVTSILDTAESLLIDELDTFQNREHLRKLRGYLTRNWTHLRPFHQRQLIGIQKAIGSCESNHRHYTYRMKGQGKYWTEKGAEAIVRLIASLKNQDLDKWMMTEYESSELIPEVEKRAKAALRAATSKKWNKADPHIGAHLVRIVGSEKFSQNMRNLVRGISGRLLSN